MRPEHLAELRIPVPDRDGVLAEITSLAADAGIGIYDIEIAHSAEGPRASSSWWSTAPMPTPSPWPWKPPATRCRAEQLS